jgi:beta-lactamase superfamily II metal-dependent hydrolase
MDFAFAGFPTAFVYEAPNGKRIDHLLWGDFVRLLGPEADGWANVRIRGTTGWMRQEDLQSNRLLEVNFVDIGQGDGCFLVTPDDKFILVDAGEGDNMIRFLRWRFNLKKHPDQVIPMQYAIISHSDSDHYRGFVPLFDDKQFTFESIFHNGIVERGGADPLGPRADIDGVSCLTDVISTAAELDALLDDPAKAGNGIYAKLLNTARKSGRVADIRMLCSEDGFLPGYEDDKELSIRALGPVPEKNGEEGRRLRWLTDKGKTKNGHSVILKLEYGKVRILLGGDLNTESEKYILEHYTGINPNEDDRGDELIERAREVFECDVAKACHHGSHDLTTLFLRSVNAAATVISSGDDEPHAHPRPEALGAFGKYSRGDRPLIFSTELARSAKENIKNPNALRREIRDLMDLRAHTEGDDARVRIDRKIEKLLEKIDRTVTVYGLINLRTDGERVVLAQKLEQGAPRGEWDFYVLAPDADGRIRYVPKR